MHLRSQDEEGKMVEPQRESTGCCKVPFSVLGQLCVSCRVAGAGSLVFQPTALEVSQVADNKSNKRQ